MPDSHCFVASSFARRAMSGSVRTLPKVMRGHSFTSPILFYREGWGRVYNDDNLYRQGLEKVNRAIGLSPQPLNIDDPDLQMHTAAELKAELEQGTERSWGDVNPLKVLRTRK